MIAFWFVSGVNGCQHRLYRGMSAESQERQPLLGNSSADTPVARQWLSRRHVMAVADTDATME
jgi:hypothetical protein